MTISVPSLWNSIQRSLDSRQSLGSSFSPLPPCSASEGPLQVKDASGARVMGASRLASAGPWRGKGTPDNSEGPANRPPWRDTAGGTLPGTNGPVKPRMMSKRKSFYARLRLSFSGCKVKRSSLWFSSVVALRRARKFCFCPSQRIHSVRIQTASGPVWAQCHTNSGRSFTGSASIITHENLFKFNQEGSLNPLRHTQTHCSRFYFSGKWN